jgi:PAS domain S-box-containing protein
MPRILAIDDNPDNLTTLEAILRHLMDDVEIIKAASGIIGLEKALTEAPDVILLDIQMPEIDGSEVCRRLKAHETTASIPVIMLTAVKTGKENHVMGLESGADAFLTKPIDEQMLVAQINTALRIKHAEDSLRRERDRLEELVFMRTMELEKQQQFLQEVLDANPSFIYAKDTSCRLTLVNRWFSDNFGISRQAVMGKTMTELMPDHPAMAQIMEENDRAIISGSRSHIEAEEQYPDRFGAIRWAHSIKVPLKDKHGQIQGLIGISRDVTDDKIRAQQRLELETQLRQAQKMEAIGTLAGGIAHDFNNILSSIIGYSELCLEEVAEKSFLEKSLQQILNGGMRARELVKQILTFSRQAEQEKMPLQIKLLIKEALKLLRASVPATIEIREEIRADDLVFGDAGQIYQVIMNLCTNAFQAMSEKNGVMQVTLDKENIGSDFPLRHPEMEQGQYLRLSISDTGTGMPAEIVDKIFDPFFTTKPDGKGTGLGLSVVHGIVHSHGGTIGVYSEQGKGSTFNIYLPVAGLGQKKIRQTDNAAPTGTESILFVDDEITLVNLAQRVLQSLGYRVETRSSSPEALALFKAKKDQFDLVITDLTMPNMAGDELARQIKTVRSDIPIIMCTGFSERFGAEDAEKLGIAAFIMKPIIKTDLARAIRNVLDHN